MLGSEVVLLSQAAEGFARAIATVLSAVFCYWFFIYGLPKVFRILGIFGNYLELGQIQEKTFDLEGRIRKIENEKKDATKGKKQ